MSPRLASVIFPALGLPGLVEQGQGLSDHCGDPASRLWGPPVARAPCPGHPSLELFDFCWLLAHPARRLRQRPAWCPGWSQTGCRRPRSPRAPQVGTSNRAAAPGKPLKSWHGTRQVPTYTQKKGRQAGRHVHGCATQTPSSKMEASQPSSGVVCSRGGTLALKRRASVTARVG